MRDIICTLYKKKNISLRIQVETTFSAFQAKLFKIKKQHINVIVIIVMMLSSSNECSVETPDESFSLIVI